MPAPIDLQDARKIIQQGSWLSIAYVSLDEKRGTAGEMIRIKRCRLAATVQSGGPATGSQAQAPAPASGGDNDRRNPQHGFHDTVNLKLANGQIRKCHMRLIVTINGQKLV